MESVMDRKPCVFRFEEYEVSERDLSVARAGKTLALEPKALRVLLYLVRNPGRLVTKDELLSAVWADTAVTENSLSRVVALLWKVLDDDIREPRFIATVPTAGYRFICPVTTADGVLSSLVAADRPNGKMGDGGVEILPGAEIHRETVHDRSDHPEPAPKPRKSVWSRRWLISVGARFFASSGSLPGICSGRCPRPALPHTSRSLMRVRLGGSQGRTEAGSISPIHPVRWERW